MALSCTLPVALVILLCLKAECTQKIDIRISAPLHFARMWINAVYSGAAESYWNTFYQKKGIILIMFKAYCFKFDYSTAHKFAKLPFSNAIFQFQLKKGIGKIFLSL